MKGINSHLAHLLVTLTAALNVSDARAQSGVQLQVRRETHGFTITWPAKVRDAAGVAQYPSFELQRSVDLKSWAAVGSPVRGAAGSEVLTASVVPDGPKAFYRVLSKDQTAARVSKLAKTGAE